MMNTTITTHINLLALTLLLTSPLLQGLVNADTTIFLAINGFHAPFWDVFMSLYSSKWFWVPLYISVAYVLTRNYKWPVALACVLVASLIIVCTDQVTSSLIRPAVARLRPSNPLNPISSLVHTVHGLRGGYGFPSAHAANSWGLMFFVHFLIRRRWLTLFFAFWALLQCYSRLYLGVHYFGDLLVGFACAAIVYHTFLWAMRSYVGDLSAIHPTKHVYVPIVVGFAIMFSFLTCAAITTCS